MQNAHEPLVSVIIPFFHSYIEHFEECLKSVQRQTYTNWELIVVDDGSIDDRAQVTVRKFSDPRMTCIRHAANRGQAAARNTGIAACRGEYFLPLDCDDVLDVTHVEKLMRALKAQPGANVAYADYQLFFASTGILRSPVRDVRTLLREQWIPHPGTLILRSLWERSRPYCEDEIFRSGNEDWDFFLSIAELGFQPAHVPEPLYWYRQHQGSITSTLFNCADYLTREYMYLRHRELFDKYRMKGTFLSGGCRVSGLAFWQKGDRFQALKLLARAVFLSPTESVRVVGRRLRRAVLNVAGNET